MSSQTTRQIQAPSFTVQAGPPTFTPPPTPRRIPFWPVAATLVLLLLAGSVYVGWRVLSGNEPRAAATPQPVVAPVAGARPQGDAPAAAPEVGGVVLDARPLAEYRLPAPHLSAGLAAATPAPHESRVSPRGGPLPDPLPGITTRPPSGAWWANRRYE